MKTLEEWKKLIDVYSVNMYGISFVNSAWIIKEIEKEYREVKT
jgi:hypothetical protein